MLEKKIFTTFCSPKDTISTLQKSIVAYCWTCPDCNKICTWKTYCNLLTCLHEHSLPDNMSMNHQCELSEINWYWLLFLRAFCIKTLIANINDKFRSSQKRFLFRYFQRAFLSFFDNKFYLIYFFEFLILFYLLSVRLFLSK